jgi:predicted Zn-dependent protease
LSSLGLCKKDVDAVARLCASSFLIMLEAVARARLRNVGEKQMSTIVEKYNREVWESLNAARQEETNVVTDEELHDFLNDLGIGLDRSDVVFLD